MSSEKPRSRKHEPGSDKPKGKRAEMRAQRRRQQRVRRLTTLIVVVLAAFGVVGFLIAPTIRDAITPVGDFVQITPTSRPMADGTAMGDPNAPVTIETFADFQCIACAIFAEDTEARVADTLVATSQVRYVFRHYPFLDQGIPGSNESQQSANASMCAAEQGRFWDYHDMLYANFQGANQGNFSNRRLAAFAESLGLDMEQFNTCFRENRYRDQIEQDRATAQSYAVSGTPSVFVNGQRVGQPQRVPTFEEIQQAVEAALPASQ